ncbi:MAG: alkylhydroperoxidase domain protein, partial [Chloroflexi bacterium]|nr:alkylhydroperoxidase domain protein [Chloroflexota bacterium]
ALDELRAQRPDARAHTQGSYAALFESDDTAALSAIERFVAALRVAVQHQASGAAAHYRQRLIAAGADPALAAATERADGALESVRLRAIVLHADLLATGPAGAGPDNLQALADAGLSTDAIVTLSQIIAFVSFQVRVLAALRLLGAAPSDSVAPLAPTATGTIQPSASASRPAVILRPGADLRRPHAFTVDQLAWTPWLQPLDLADATPEQAAALEGTRGNSPYFRLLARDVRVLTERTATDRGIFYTPAGAPRAERELAAAATSRLNGCVYCASVHARLAGQLSKRTEDINRLLREGVAPGTSLNLDHRWQAVVDLAVGLASTPSSATPADVARARQAGFSDLELLDVLQAGAFFAWANRLMLTLGEPYCE